MTCELTAFKRKDKEGEKEYREKDNRIKDLERQLKQTCIDKDNFLKEIGEMQDKISLQGKEVQDALSQRKLAMSEYSEVSDKLVILFYLDISSNLLILVATYLNTHFIVKAIIFNFFVNRLTELRNQKQKMLRQVRDKEEELETAMQKIDTLRQDLRKSDKLKREIEVG